MTELEEKTERLARLSRESDVGGIVVVSQPGFAWLTGGGSNRIDGSRENGSGALFVRADGRRYVIANAIEMPRLLDEELAGGDWEPVEYPWAEEHARPTVVNELASALAERSGAGIGADWPITGCVPLDSACARLRAPLTGAEVTRYRALGAEAGTAVGDVARQVTPGMTEEEVARRIYDAARSIGGRATVVLVAADERLRRFRHPVPTATVWKQILMLVTCIQRGGLVVALSRIVAAGPPDAETVRRTDATAQVFARLLQATRAGARGRDLFAVAQRAYADAGFAGEELRHHQGGAIGYRSREWVAHPSNEETVNVPQAFAWNPSIAGTKVEDTALLTEGGIDLITTTRGWPTLAHGAAGILTV